MKLSSLAIVLIALAPLAVALPEPSPPVDEAWIQIFLQYSVNFAGTHYRAGGELSDGTPLACWDDTAIAEATLDGLTTVRIQCASPVSPLVSACRTLGLSLTADGPAAAQLSCGNSFAVSCDNTPEAPCPAQADGGTHVEHIDLIVGTLGPFEGSGWYANGVAHYVPDPVWTGE